MRVLLKAVRLLLKAVRVLVKALRAVFRIHMFLGLPDPDPLVRDMDPDPLVKRHGSGSGMTKIAGSGSRIRIH